MQLSRPTSCFALVAVLAAAAVRPADAATATANLNVTASVIQVCQVFDGTLAFGPYDPLAAAPLETNGSFQVACTKGSVSVTLGLGQGLHFAGSQRGMSNTTDTLTYEIYKEAARTNVWGDVGGAVVPYTATTSALTTIQVFGRIPALQTNVGVGTTYSDTVVITVTF